MLSRHLFVIIWAYFIEAGTLIFWILTAAITAAWFAIDIFAYEWTRRFSVAHFEASPEVQAAIEKEWQEYENLSPEENAKYKEILERERDREIQRQIDRDRYGW